MKETCADCKHCSRENYCEIKDEHVRPENIACPEFEEN